MRKLFVTSSFCVLLLCCLSASNRAVAQGINTVAGNGSRGYSGDGGAATAATLYNPCGLAFDTSGNLYFADEGNDRIRKVNFSGIVSTVAGNGFGGYSGDGGAATGTKLYIPHGVEVDRSGNIYIADSYNNRVRKIMASGIINTIAGNGTAGYSGDGGAATAAELNNPWDVAIDGSGNVYISDELNHRIRKITPAGSISTIAGNGISGYSGDGGAATAAKIYGPEGLAVDGGGNVYIADRLNQRVRKITPFGTISTIAGNGMYGHSGDGGAATAAELNHPNDVTVDFRGNVYISDEGNYCVRKLTVTGIINTIAGTGTYGYSGDGGPATGAQLSVPAGVVVDHSGNIFVADAFNYRIRKVDSCVLPHVAAITGSSSLCTGISTTLADTAADGTWSSSNAAVASVNAATGVVTGVASGSVTVAYIASNSCGADTATQTIAVNPLPVAGSISGTDSLCPGLTTTLTNTSTGGTWISTNSSIASISSTGTLTSLTAGSVNILYIVTNTCGSDTAVFPFLVRDMTACPDEVTDLQNKANSSLQLYPNPNNGELTVHLSSTFNEQVHFTITNMLGEKVTELVSLTNQDIRIQLRVPPGIYFIAAVTNGERLVRKIVVE